MKTKTYVHNLSRIAWAYVFLLIDFSMSVNDFSINVLPGWVGFLLIFLRFLPWKNRNLRPPSCGPWLSFSASGK